MSPASKASKKPGKRPPGRAKETPQVDLKEQWSRLVGIEGNPNSLDELARRAMVDFWSRAERDESTAFRFISLLNDLCDLVSLVEEGDDVFHSVSSKVPEWPLALSPKKQDAKERKEKLRSIQKVGASYKKIRVRLRSDLADSIECYISVIAPPGTFWLDGKPAPCASAPLSIETLQEYQEKAWELFIRDYGKRFEGHPAMKSIAPEKLQGQPVSPGKRRDMIRDAWEGAWKTIARQVASQK